MTLASDCAMVRAGKSSAARVEIGEEELHSPAVSACLAGPRKLATGE
jgi:hypothetical protein